MAAPTRDQGGNHQGRLHRKEEEDTTEMKEEEEDADVSLLQ